MRKTVTATGRKSAAEIPVAAAVPWIPGNRVPTVWLSRM